MILDTSAILAILFGEPDWQVLLDALQDAEMMACGAPTLTETGIVLGSRPGFDKPHLHRFLQEFGVTVIPLTEIHWSEAVIAYERFGKGRHKAALNFGGCLSYAAAKLAQQPLLCTGKDFTHTDLQLVRY